MNAPYVHSAHAGVAQHRLSRVLDLPRSSLRGMTEVLLLHHAHGRTDGVQAFAETLRAADHAVHVPDLYEGRIFESLDDGLAYARQVGFGTLVERGRAAAEALPADLVYLGMSLGVVAAQMLAQTRQQARGAVLLHSCMPVSEFSPTWPDDVPVQVHGMDADELFVEGGDLDAARELVAAAPDAELFLYPGDQHLFTDSSLPAYDEAAAGLVTERVLGLLARV